MFPGSYLRFRVKSGHDHSELRSEEAWRPRYVVTASQVLIDRVISRSGRDLSLIRPPSALISSLPPDLSILIPPGDGLDSLGEWNVDEMHALPAENVDSSGERCWY